MSELIDAISAGFELPGDDYRWGFRVCREGGHSSRDFVWPTSGPVAAFGPFDEGSDDPCPSWSGDGICLATTWEGVTSGGLPAELFLLAGYRPVDVLGADTGKVRVRAATVVAAWSAADFVRRLLPAWGMLDWAYLRGADLRGVDLRGANLRYAHLRGANLPGADLTYTNLFGANLRAADLSGANLSEADLSGADLIDANLAGAVLRRAELHSAYLRAADLSGANLSEANLTGADLTEANLCRANLRDADLRDADLRDADLTGANRTGLIT